MKLAVIFGMMLVMASEAGAIVTPPKEISLGLQGARRVVRTELRRESRALGWSQFVVTKHKQATAPKKSSSGAN